MVIACRSAVESSRRQCWAGFITSTFWNPPHDAGPRNSSPLFVFAEHTPSERIVGSVHLTGPRRLEFKCYL
jgi:hypothetical protein